MVLCQRVDTMMTIMIIMVTCLVLNKNSSSVDECGHTVGFWIRDLWIQNHLNHISLYWHVFAHWKSTFKIPFNDFIWNVIYLPFQVTVKGNLKKRWNLQLVLSFTRNGLNKPFYHFYPTNLVNLDLRSGPIRVSSSMFRVSCSISPSVE